jgi:16S rRNA G966 N2-methylase RsmD
VDDVEDVEGLNQDCRAIRTATLISGSKITFPTWLCGGGQVHKKYFLKILRNKRYENAFEWCAGHGEIGFELITAGICKTLSFSDLHPASEKWCLKNAEELGLADQIAAYTTPVIANIPQNKRWDLVVGNPPNSAGVDHVILARFYEERLSKDHIQLYVRTTFDIEFEAHREFFKNIKNYITADADIFLTVHSTVLDQLMSLPELSDFKVENVYDMFPDPYPEYQTNANSPTDPDLKVVHFKQKYIDNYSQL